MIISIAPMIAIHLDSGMVNAVIMQLEIENQSAKGTDPAKEMLNKGEWLTGLSKFKFCSPQIDLASSQHVFLRNYPIQAFYPSVPTPPPNC